MSEFKIIVPTMSRAGKMTTHKYCADVILCVPESQKDEYAEHYPDLEMCVHSDEVIGLSAKKQWIADKFQNCFYLDDDLDKFIYMGIGAKEKNHSFSPEDVRDTIINLYEAACDCGAYLFGFNNVADVRMYNPMHPFKFTGFLVGGVMGVRDWKESNLWFDERFMIADDYWLGLLNAYFNRYVLKDCRFSFDGDTGHMEGGNAQYRNWNQEKKELLLLKRMFGDAVQIKTDSPYKKATGTTNRHPFERVMRLPY